MPHPHSPATGCFFYAFLENRPCYNGISRHNMPQSWWRHQMETCSALLALCAGNSPVPVNSPHKGQWRGALMLSLICAWINDWVNNHEAGYLRRHRGHYDVNVMKAEMGQHRGAMSASSELPKSELEVKVTFDPQSRPIWDSKVIFKVKSFSGECHRIPLMINQNLFMWWPGAVRKQTIAWANVDPNFVAILDQFLTSIMILNYKHHFIFKRLRKVLKPWEFIFKYILLSDHI